MGKGKGGMPLKLTPDVQDKICELIRQGNYIFVACQACNISTQNYAIWKKRGAKGEEPFKTFLEAVTQAEVAAEVARIERIEEAGKGGQLIKVTTRTLRDGTEVKEETYSQPAWPADMTILERRHPERWGRRTKLVGDEDNPLYVAVTKIRIEDAKRRS